MLGANPPDSMLQPTNFTDDFFSGCRGQANFFSRGLATSVQRPCPARCSAVPLKGQRFPTSYGAAASLDLAEYNSNRRSAINKWQIGSSRRELLAEGIDLS